MKRVISLLICLLLLSMSVFAAPDEEFAASESFSPGISAEELPKFPATMFELFMSWKNDYPEYVCGVWSTDGTDQHMAVGILNNDLGEKGKQEILAQIEDDENVTFVYQKYSHSELLKVIDEIVPYLDEKSGLASFGLDDINNCINVDIVKEDVSDDFLNMLSEKYGDKVAVNYLDEYPSWEEEDLYIGDIGAIDNIETIGEKKTDVNKLFIVLSAIVIAGIAVAAYFTVKNKVAVTDTGDEITVNDGYSDKDVIESVKNTGIALSKETNEKIYEDINKL